MKGPTAACALLCANVVLAAPGTAMRRQRAAAKIARRSVSRIRPADSELEVTGANGTAHVEFSDNWAGAVLLGLGYTSVTGTIVVPTPRIPPGGNSFDEYSASAWVGIDGDTCLSALLQTGVDFTVSGSSVTYSAWYEWFPEDSYDFDDISIAAGDTITMTVTATSKKSGTAVIENVTTGNRVAHSFSGQTDRLCETNAEWIVEDYGIDGSWVPFADFGSVTFTGASVNHGSVGTSGANIFEIMKDDMAVTSCSISRDSTVTCNYLR